VTPAGGGCWIPAWVLHANISANAKILYGRIEALATREGYCWATDEFFSEEFAVSERSVSRWLTELEEARLVRRETKGPKRALIPRGAGKAPKGRQKCLGSGEKADENVRLSQTDSSGSYNKELDIERDIERATDEQRALSLELPAPNGNGNGKRKKKRATALPPSWEPTESHRKRADEAGLDVVKESMKFRLYAEENGKTAKSWTAAFTRWLINAEEYADRDGRRVVTVRKAEGTGPVRWYE
jgi:hypothetical protein